MHAYQTLCVLVHLRVLPYAIAQAYERVRAFVNLRLCLSTLSCIICSFFQLQMKAKVDCKSWFCYVHPSLLPNFTSTDQLLSESACIMRFHRHVVSSSTTPWSFSIVIPEAVVCRKWVRKLWWNPIWINMPFIDLIVKIEILRHCENNSEDEE